MTMSVRSRGKGGKHVAIERGLRPTGSGWPFRRELRELRAQIFEAPIRTSLPIIPSESEPKPCQA